MNQNSRTRYWFWGGITGLVLVSVVFVLVLVNLNNPSADESPSSVGGHKPNARVPSLPNPVSEPLVQTVQEDTPLPALDFPPGSVEEACGLNKYVSYHYDGTAPWPKSPYNAKGELVALQESQECTEALEACISSINPYLWGENFESPKNLQFAFFVLDEPLTFGRIFADPMGDFHRVQEALSNPECLLKGDETNWELEETCHADAFPNYALFNRFCFKEGDWGQSEGVSNRNRTYYWVEDNPTPEQDRFMWKQRLESHWVEHKCKEISPTFELTLEQNPVLYELVMSLDPSDRKKGSLELLIELAARLGDNAAGLTQSTSVSYSHSYDENGKKYGRFFGLLESDRWRLFNGKEPPAPERFLQVFYMLTMISTRKPDPRNEIQFDWEVVAQHLCTPPYYNDKSWYDNMIRNLEGLKSYDARYADNLVAFRDKYDNPNSCQEIIHELRQQDIYFRPLLDILDKFEQVALKLDVYD